jgi:hypothetical protein
MMMMMMMMMMIKIPTRLRIENQLGAGFPSCARKTCPRMLMMLMMNNLLLIVTPCDEMSELGKWKYYHDPLACMYSNPGLHKAGARRTGS